MIFLGELIKINDNNFISNFQHMQPFSEFGGLGKTEKELNEIGILVKSLPGCDYISGKLIELHVNPQTKEVWYEYTEIPKSDEELTKDTIENLQKDNAQLLKENVKKDVIIESLSKDISDIYKLIGVTK